MKKNQGISIIELAIVIIIMLIIAGFAIYNGYSSIEKAQATEIYTEMNNMISAVSGVVLQKELGNENDEWLQSFYDEEGSNGWYLIYGMNHAGYEESNTRKNLNLDSIKRDYLVNFETGEVNLAVPTEVLGRSVRTYESIRTLVESDKI